MRTANSNLIVLEAEIVDAKILGTAIDGDIKVLFAVAASEVNQRLFVPEANIVVTGKFRLGREICTIGIWITSVIAVVSLPNPVTAEVEAPVEMAVAAEVEVPALATKQKRASSRTSKKAKAVGELAPV
jgi:hypothetical protein